MNIGILGDTHGANAWTCAALDVFKKEGIDIILQLGDFGIYDSTPGHYFLKNVNKTLEKNDQTLYFVPGNHEDWDYIERLQETALQDDGWAKVRSRIFFAPRGHRWEWDGVSFLGLGGAPSVDRQWRLQDMRRMNGKQKLWWAQEQITQADVDKVVAGGHADVMVCHDAPNGVPTVDGHISGNPMGFDPIDLEYAAVGRALMTEAYKGVKPDTFLHGHYHFPVNDMVLQTSSDDGTVVDELKWGHVVGLGCNGQAFALGHYDTTARKAYIWDMRGNHDNYVKKATE